MKNDKQEYGTDSYNRAGNVSKPIAPSKGFPSTSMHHKRDINNIPMKKQVEQSLLKRHCKFLSRFPFKLELSLTKNLINLQYSVLMST